MAFIADPLVHTVIGCCIRIHQAFGPGLYESAYGKSCAAEFENLGIQFKQEVTIPLSYLGRPLGCAYRIDFVLEHRLLLELKCVERFAPVHGAQVLTYLKLSGLKQGLLINFNVTRLVDGVRSFVNGLSTYSGERLSAGADLR